MEERLNKAIHDIANNLTIIIGNSEILRDSFNSDDQSQVQRLQRIEKSAINIKELLDTLKS